MGSEIGLFPLLLALITSFALLGPRLFTVFIDDLEVKVELEALTSSKTKFADNTKGIQEIASDEDREKMQRSMQRALALFSKWAFGWGMMFNVAKPKVMHIELHKPRYEYYMEDKS